MPTTPDGLPAGEFTLTYIIGTYPSLTTTFIDREIELVQQEGVTVQVLAIRRPSGSLSAGQLILRRLTRYLLPVNRRDFVTAHLRFAVQRPRRYFGTLLYLVSRPQSRFRARLKTVLHFAEGVYAAHLLRQKPGDHLHAHFVDRAATVALVAGRLLNRPYSVTAHANDIYVDPVLLPEKLGEAQFVATCTGYNREHLAKLGGKIEAKLHCIYHGLDAGSYHPAPAPVGGLPLITAVGQLKEKKGFVYLIRACRILRDQGYQFACQITGGGPQEEALRAEIEALSLGDTVSLCGPQPHEAVIEAYRRSTLFVLPCVLGADGDRDGIPNVILEAMAMELPVVSTRHSGIPEVITDGCSGLLVPPGNPAALAEAIARLLDDGELRLRLGREARRTVSEMFHPERNVRRLLAAIHQERLDGQLQEAGAV